ncbi:MAG: TRZ/ATZ family hydrolase [Gammaproteobacteria bacterium]|nr:MAG: TRZ/ATZ family hydrolase [Gammaproteobacteria bacterium]
MEQVQTLIHGKTIIPMSDDTKKNTSNNNAHVLTDYSIAIQDGRILDVLATSEATAKYSSESNLDYKHHIIIPGLINAHTHAAMSLFRGLANDLHLMEWLEKHIWPAEQKWVNEDFVQLGTQLAIAEMLRGGVTCFNDMYFFSETTAQVATKSGIRAHIGMILLDFPTQYANNADEYFSKGLALYDQFKAHPLVKCTFAPHAPYTVSNAPLERVAMLANELELPVHIHLHETRDEISQSMEQHKARPLQRLHDIGLVNSGLLAVHMTHIEDQEINLLAETNANVVHCPQSNLKLASGYCPVQKLRDKNINVALGTDSCASNDDQDMLSEMHSAALLAKGVANNAAALPAYEALRCATINAATALGIDQDTGSLEIGKSADLAVIDIDILEAQPMYDPIGHVVYATQRSQVSDVWVAGKQLLSNRELLTLDKNEILAKTKEWNQKINQ